MIDGPNTNGFQRICVAYQEILAHKATLKEFQNPRPQEGYHSQSRRNALLFIVLLIIRLTSYTVSIIAGRYEGAVQNGCAHLPLVERHQPGKQVLKVTRPRVVEENPIRFLHAYVIALDCCLIPLLFPSRSPPRACAAVCCIVF